jgi:hypothetical protein
MGANVLMIHPRPNDPRLATVREFTTVYSYDRIMTMSTMALPTVKSDALEKRRAFLIEIVSKGVATATNPVADLPEYRGTRILATVKAAVYRAVVKAAVRITPAQSKYRRIYGLKATAL